MTPTNQDYIRYLKRRSLGGNWFLFFKDYLEIMSIEAAIVVQFILNQGKRKPKTKEALDLWRENYVLCTSKYLLKALKLTQRVQRRILNELQGKDKRGNIDDSKVLIKIKHVGLPAKRYIKVDLLKIEQEIDKRVSSSEYQTVLSYSTERYSLTVPNGTTTKIKDKEEEDNKDSQQEVGRECDPLDSFDIECATRLYEKVLAENHMTVRGAVDKWKRGFRRARKKVQNDLSRIKEDLNYLIEHYEEDQYMPQIRSGDSFNEKLDKLEARIKRGKPARMCQNCGKWPAIVLREGNGGWLCKNCKEIW